MRIITKKLGFLALVMLCVSTFSVVSQAQVKAGGSVTLGIQGPVGAVDSRAPVDGMRSKKYYQNCSGHLPVGFSPSTRDEFCTCASVTITQVMSNGELDMVLGQKKLGDPEYDKALIKYVGDVVIPCMDAPIRTLGYSKCLETRTHDNRIRSFPAYCSCVGDIASRMLQDRGENDLIRHFRTMEMDRDATPEESFVRSATFQTYVNTGIRACIQPAFMQW